MRCNHRLLGRGLEDPALHEAAANYLRSTFDGRTLPGVSVVDEPFIPPLEPTITARRRARGPR
jgi:hypothetical protein